MVVREGTATDLQLRKPLTTPDSQPALSASAGLIARTPVWVYAAPSHNLHLRRRPVWSACRVLFQPGRIPRVADLKPWCPRWSVHKRPAKTPPLLVKFHSSRRSPSRALAPRGVSASGLAWGSPPRGGSPPWPPPCPPLAPALVLVPQFHHKYPPPPFASTPFLSIRSAHSQPPLAKGGPRGFRAVWSQRALLSLAARISQSSLGSAFPGLNLKRWMIAELTYVGLKRCDKHTARMWNPPAPRQPEERHVAGL